MNEESEKAGAAATILVSLPERGDLDRDPDSPGSAAPTMASPSEVLVTPRVASPRREASAATRPHAVLSWQTLSGYFGDFISGGKEPL